MCEATSLIKNRCAKQVSCNWPSDVEDLAEPICKATNILISNYRLMTALSGVATIIFAVIVYMIHKRDEVKTRKTAKLIIGYLALISQAFHCIYSITFVIWANNP